MANDAKIELTWIGKDKRPEIEPRALIGDPAKSHHAAMRHGDTGAGRRVLEAKRKSPLQEDRTIRIDCENLEPVYALLGWKGGGGCRFYELAPTHVKEDASGQNEVDGECNAETPSKTVDSGVETEAAE